MNKFITWLVELLYPMPSETKIQKIWDSKADNQIQFAYHDAIGWINLSEGLFGTKTVKEVAESCQQRLDIYIIPQMQKRKIKGLPAAQVDAFMDEYVRSHPD